MHLADLTSYSGAQQRLGELYADPDAWARKTIINVASSGKFSSDRTIAEYAAGIWNAMPCPVQQLEDCGVDGGCVVDATYFSQTSYGKNTRANQLENVRFLGAPSSS